MGAAQDTAVRRKKTDEIIEVRRWKRGKRGKRPWETSENGIYPPSKIMMMMMMMIIHWN